MQAVHTELEERFLRYVQIHTTSDAHSTETPSTARQWDLLRLLEQELRVLGAADVTLTPYACLLATIPATADRPCPTVALLAHVDTATEFSGADVRPIVHRRYAGGPIALPDDPAQVIDPQQFPYLNERIGDDIVTASGLTLLGADDKAGVAILMTLAHIWLTQPELPHGRIRLCFTPDEEIGRGVANLTLAELDADVAYTLDGGRRGEIVYETFSADRAVVSIAGVSIHPGYAYGKMVNATHLAARLIERLGAAELTPAESAGRNGFIHVTAVQGNSAVAELHLILRDFTRDGLAAKGALVQRLCDELQTADPRARITCAVTPQYRNMRDWLERDMRPVTLAVQAAQAVGLTPSHAPTRGGTDGSRLTEMGLPTPNLFTGMQNPHGPLEWVSIQDMGQAVAVCLRLAEQWSAEPPPSVQRTTPDEKA